MGTQLGRLSSISINCSIAITRNGVKSAKIKSLLNFSRTIHVHDHLLGSCVRIGQSVQIESTSNSKSFRAKHLPQPLDHTSSLIPPPHPHLNRLLFLSLQLIPPHLSHFRTVSPTTAYSLVAGRLRSRQHQSAFSIDSEVVEASSLSTLPFL